MLAQARSLLVGISLVVLMMCSSAISDDATDARAKKFVDAHVTKMKPLDKEAGIAWWDANTSGKDEDKKTKK